MQLITYHGNDIQPNVFLMYQLNLWISVNTIMNKLQTLWIKQVDTEIFEMRPKTELIY